MRKQCALILKRTEANNIRYEIFVNKVVEKWIEKWIFLVDGRVLSADVSPPILLDVISTFLHISFVEELHNPTLVSVLCRCQGNHPSCVQCLGDNLRTHLGLYSWIHTKVLRLP